WGARVIVPAQGRQAILTELHHEHPGMPKMKMLARSYVWWPGLDTDITALVRRCQECQQGQRVPPAVPLHPWEWPGRPWTRLHIDHAGPFMGSMFLVIVDAHSKWLDVHRVNTASTASAIEKLRASFATHGRPEVLGSDNGTEFTSGEFGKFLKENGVRHIKTAPYHPATNGLAERAVQTLKAGLKKQPAVSIDTKLSRWLFDYRTTPHSTTGIPPAELLMGRRLRTRLSLLFP
ncbi:uncharacterized protein K02A2.6-like, partial [Scyliorhinus canicula]|uniref:uncharacterized protein K02A2.6-like n=1 Tax=Scyliorhinus canicula TaxID=7830 RepID=UPI0018F4F473